MIEKRKVIMFLSIILVLIIFLIPIKEVIKKPSILGAVLTKVYIIPSATPILDDIPNQAVNIGQEFYLDVNATDPYGYSLTFYDNSNLFDIGSSTGIISFIPVSSQIGSYTINISVTNSYFWDSEIFTLTINDVAPYCGDGTCNGDETCSTCSDDCGECETGAGEDAGTGGAGGAAEEYSEAYYGCSERWQCEEWSSCSIDGRQTRKCTDLNKCGTTKKKPTTVKECTYIPTCSDGIQNGDETGVDCGGSCPPCPIPACDDGVQNQGEEDVDCGGPCPPCEIKKYAKLPSIKKPKFLEKIKKKFPWTLILAISILLSLTIAGDRVYVRRITKKELEEYRKKAKKYKLIRDKLYKGVITISIITFIIALYIFWFSDCVECMKKYAWILATIILFSLTTTFVIIKRYKYSEYRKRKKELRLMLMHKQETKRLIDLEDKLLLDLEDKLRKKICDLVKKKEFENYKALYAEFQKFYDNLSKLYKTRKEKINSKKKDKNTIAIIKLLLKDDVLKKLSKQYPEFKAVIDNLNELNKAQKKQNYIAEEDFIRTMKDISKPHLLLVIKSRPEYIKLYNRLVDIYESYKAKSDDTEIKEESIMEEESLCCNKIEKIASNAELLDIIKLKPDFAFAYNTLVDLFSHYKKKEEIYNDRILAQRKKAHAA